MDDRQPTDALGRQFEGTAPYVAQQASGFAHQTPQETRAGALKAPGNRLGIRPAAQLHAARASIMEARVARAAGDTRAAHYHLQDATSARGAAMDALGIAPSPRVFQRPNAWRYGDLKATRRLP